MIKTGKKYRKHYGIKAPKVSKARNRKAKLYFQVKLYITLKADIQTFFIRILRKRAGFRD
jgi:hypothetical protein